jgi:cytidine deaminase
MTIDWPVLRARATQAADRAYAPYSRLRVGAAGLASDGRIVQGCNVENASYGLTLCAECGLVSALHAGGGGRLLAVSVVAVKGEWRGTVKGERGGGRGVGGGAPLVPCGRCRQLLLEAGGPGLLVDAEGGPCELGSLLPSAFSAADLPERRDVDA